MSPSPSTRPVARRAPVIALATLATGLAVAAAASAAPPSPTATIAVPPSPTATIEPALARRLDDGPERVPILVTLRSAPEVRGGGSGELLRTLRRSAARSQPSVLAGLPRPARRLWIVNAVAVRARPAEIIRLARNPAVARIDYDRPLRLLSPADGRPYAPPGLFGRGGWGLAAIGAPAVWRDYGLDGRGVRVGSIDTGVAAGHPDLAGKTVAWRDFVNGRPTPYDDNGHGTHTIGTMVGGGTDGAPIGVAPAAKVVVAKALDRYGTASLSTLMAAAEWIADPDGNPATADQPTVVNASWGLSGGNAAALRPILRRWRELGIVPVFAAGNSGPRGDVLAPARYPEAIAVGAVGPRRQVALFSSRGQGGGMKAAAKGGRRVPSPRKPDLSAPGVEVRSSVPSRTWASQNGTSMASPHVAGAIALLRQADPRLSVDAIETILRRTADRLPPHAAAAAGGAGTVDVLAAAARVLGPRPHLPGLSLVAVPPATTHRDVVTIALDAGTPVRVWVDGVTALARVRGPLVRVPLGAPGRHTLTVATLVAEGAPVSRRSLHVTIDRERPHLRLEVHRTGLLGIAYRTTVSDAGGLADGSLWTRLSDSPNLRGNGGGRHQFITRGPYWVEAQVSDVAGNVTRVRRRLTWPRRPLLRRINRIEAFTVLDTAFSTARRHRRFAGHYRPSARLARLLGANLPFASFTGVAGPGACAPTGVVGVWSDGRHSVVLSMERAGRRFLVEDRDGRVRWGTAPASGACRAAGPSPAPLRSR